MLGIRSAVTSKRVRFLPVEARSLLSKEELDGVDLENVLGRSYK